MGKPRNSSAQMITLHLIDPPVGFMSTPAELKAWKRELEKMAQTMPQSTAVPLALADVNRWLKDANANP